MTLISDPFVTATGLVTTGWAALLDTEPTLTGIVPRRIPVFGADARVDRVWRVYFETKGIPPVNAAIVDDTGRLTPAWRAFLSED